MTVGFPPVGQPPGGEDHHVGPGHGPHRPQRQPGGKILGAQVLAAGQVLGVQRLDGPDMVAGIAGGGQPQGSAQKLPQLGVVLCQQRRGEHGSLAVRPVPGGPQTGGQHPLVVEGQQRRRGLQGVAAPEIPQQPPVGQRTVQRLPGQLGQSARPAEGQQGLPVTRQQHPGVKGGGSFQSLQHTKIPFLSKDEYGTYCTKKRPPNLPKQGGRKKPCQEPAGGCFRARASSSKLRLAVKQRW